MCGGHTDDGRDLRPTADLLNLVFGFQPPIESNHLDWYYRDNPNGRASVGRAYDDGRLVGNYALVPLQFQSGHGPDLRLGLGVDLSTHPDSGNRIAFLQGNMDRALALYREAKVSRGEKPNP